MKKTLISFSLLSFFISFSLAGNIVVGTKTYPVDTLAHFKVGPGSYYTALSLVDATAPLRVFFLEVDAKNQYTQLKAVLARDSTVTCEKTSAMAIRKTTAGNTYFGGINGGMFAAAGNLSQGCMVGGEVARAPYVGVTDIAFDRDKVPFIDTKAYYGKVYAGDSLSPSLLITNINVARATNNLILYNQLNGHYTHTNQYGCEVRVQLTGSSTTWDVNKFVNVKVMSKISGQGNMAIPVGEAVLSGNGTAETFLNALNVNDVISIKIKITLNSSTEKPLLTDMVGGDRQILQHGLVTDNDWAALNPRTAVGYSSDKSKIYFCIVDGRSTISVGVSTKQLADIIKSAGASEAINLDGGGSSTLYVKGLNLMNIVSDGTERAVGNGLFAVSSAPTDVTISEISAYKKTVELPKNGTLTPTFLGYNQYGALLNTNVQGVTLSCPAALGSVNGGTFTASGTQNGVLTATYNSIQTTVNIITLNGTGIDKHEMSNVYISLNGNQIHISEEVALAEIYSITGQKVASVTNVSSIKAPVVKGIYIVIVVDKASAKKIQKVAVN